MYQGCFEEEREENEKERQEEIREKELRLKKFVEKQETPRLESFESGRQMEKEREEKRIKKGSQMIVGPIEKKRREQKNLENDQRQANERQKEITREKVFLFVYSLFSVPLPKLQRTTRSIFLRFIFFFSITLFPFPSFASLLIITAVVH